MPKHVEVEVVVRKETAKTQAGRKAKRVVVIRGERIDRTAERLITAKSWNKVVCGPNDTVGGDYT